MKKLLFTLILIAVLAACGGPASQPTPLPTQPPPTSTPSPTEVPTPVELTPAQLAAINALAESLGIRVEEIKVVSVEAVQWPDSCLGITYPNARCAQVITPGFNIILEAGGTQYEYHTNESGSAVASAVATLTWHREGGFAGFCDDLVVVVSGQAQASSCAPSTAYPPGELTDEELAQFKEWAASFSSVIIEMQDPAVADAMTILLIFSGNGSGQPTEAEQQAMLNWAQSVYDRLKP